MPRGNRGRREKLRPDLQTFGKKVRALRIDWNVTKAELAAAANMSSSAIYEYENGYVMPSLDSAWRLSKTLGISLDDLCADFDRTRMRRPEPAPKALPGSGNKVEGRTAPKKTGPPRKAGKGGYYRSPEQLEKHARRQREYYRRNKAKEAERKRLQLLRKRKEKEDE